tara:strand:- start:359 stop:658 length:300 start_codon:yes stop_codon:yes gene_type:complete
MGTALIEFHDSYTGISNMLIADSTLLEQHRLTTSEWLIYVMGESAEEDCSFDLEVMQMEHQRTVSVAIVKYNTPPSRSIGAVIIYRNHARTERPMEWFI